jgi:hypothetical protein
LDLFEHGVPAYPEYALHAAANPSGAKAFNAAAFATPREIVRRKKRCERQSSVYIVY